MTATDDRPRTWNDPGGPLVQPARDDWELGRRARATVAAMTDNGRNEAAAQVLEVQGRRVSDRLADEAQQRRDFVESSQAVADARVPDSPWLTARTADRTTERLRERHTAARPRPGDYVGRGDDIEAARHGAWQSWFADRHGLEVDDLEMDAMRDHGWGIDSDDMHYRSPDLDDLDDPMEDTQ